MPYSGADDPNLPDNVKNLPEEKRKQWVHVFMSVLKKGGSESSAFAQANGVVKKELNPDDADPVDTDIKEPVLEVVPVDNLLDKIVSAIKSLLNPSRLEPPVQADKVIWKFYKSTDGVRFFVVYSNNFKDRQNEIVTEGAHKEYINWATENNQYPDLWLWHAGPQSKFGKVDFLDYVDGFCVASGLIDADKAYIVEELDKEDLGVSHGFKGLVSNNLIVRYRSFEISPLPRWAAANIWTPTKLKDIEMGFDPKKKEWLKSVAKVSDEVITSWEKSLETLSTDLKALGVEYKESEPDDITGQIANLTGVVSQLVTTINGINTKLTDFDGQIKQLSKDMDTKVAEHFEAQVAKLPKGVEASKNDNNIVDQKTKENDLSWFGPLVGVK